MSITVEKLEYKSDRMEQYSRRNSILIHGLPQVKGEDNKYLVIKKFKEKMGLDILSANIDRLHCIGDPPK